MHKILVRWTVPCVVVLLAFGGWSTTSAQTIPAAPLPWRVVQGTDSTLYLVTGDTRFVVSPDMISDVDLAALIDGGSMGGQLPMPTVSPPPVVVVAPAAPLPVLAEPTSILIPPTRIPAPAPTNTPIPANTPVPATATAIPKPQPVTVASSGRQKTAPFTLAAGNYAISWSGADPGGRFGGGNFSVELNGLNSGDFELIANVILKSGETQSSTTNAYNLKGGQYYLDVSADGNWKVTFTPQ